MRTLIIGATLVDGTGAPAREDVTVVVEDHLVAEGGVGADELRADIAADRGAGLLAGDVLGELPALEERFEAQLAQRLRDVRLRLARPGAAAAREGGGGEGPDVGLQAGGLGLGGRFLGGGGRG